MNEQERADLARLKERQARLEQELGLLSRELTQLEQRMGQAESSARPAVSARNQPAPAQQAAGPAQPRTPSPGPPPIPPIIKPPETRPAQPQKAAPLAAMAEAKSPGSLAQAPAGLKPIERSAPAVPALGSQPRTDSLEMRLGTYWLVRIGIVLVLTALVFFGTLAYQRFISQLGPGGKTSLLYLASALLLGAGWFWQRQAAKEALRNYAQVLFAGGLAALYFTTYAAHHIEALRIITSPTLDGFLLLLCTGFIVWVADLKKSEVLAMFAVGLAYYTSIITRVGYFTLYSNLLLTGAAVFFLVRNRWVVISFGSLMASYGAYAFWRFFNGEVWHWAPAEGLWAGTYFLMSYWVVLTAAVFLCQDKKFSGQNRASFLTLNNGAFFAMFLLTMFQVRHGGFWKFAMIYGIVLLALAEVARRLLAAEPLSKNSYLTQGLLLVTVGFISKYAGLQLALILAMESVVLLISGQQRKNAVLLAGAYIAAALSVGWAMDGMRQMESKGIWLACGIGAMMLANTILIHRELIRSTPHPPGSEDQVNRPNPGIRPQAAYFTILALVIWFATTWNNSLRENFALILACEGVLLTLSIYVLGIPEISFFAQGYIVIAQLVWTSNILNDRPLPPWWNALLLLALTLAMGHWWQRQKALRLSAGFSSGFQAAYALAVVAVLYVWLGGKVSAPMWLVLTSALAVALTTYGVLTRAWWIAGCGQIFVLVSVLQLARQIWESKPGWQFALAPLAGVAVLSWATVRWFESHANADARVREPLLQVARVYRWSGLVMALAWVWQYIPASERIWVLALLGLAVFVWAGYARSREGLLFSAVFTSAALLIFWLPLTDAPKVYWPNLLAILTVLAQQQVAWRWTERYSLEREVHSAVIVIGGLTLWLYLSRLVLEQASGFYLTASWSALALLLFATGIILRERTYRWLGLGILGLALGRVVIFDIWKLEALYRVLSLLALGVVLLVLGFIYSKYQEKIKEWL